MEKMIKVLHFCLTMSNSIFVHLCKKSPCDSEIGPKIEIQKLRIKMRIKVEKPMIKVDKPMIEVEKPMIKVEKPMIKVEKPMIKAERPMIEVQRLMIEVKTKD